MVGEIRERRHRLGWLVVLCALCATGATGCEEEDDDDDDVPCEDAGASPQLAALEAVCDPENGSFSTEIDNPWFPMPVGSVRIFEGEEDGVALRVEMTVLDETEEVAGVQTRVIEENETEDGEVVEISRNFLAQASDGTVCYFGEDVDIYEGGEVIAHDGAWRAGQAGAEAGILMPAEPVVGMSYAQERAPEVAFDHASHVDEGATITVAAGTYDETISTLEWTPLEPGDISRKSYAMGVGMIVDDVVTLTSFEQP